MPACAIYNTALAANAMTEGGWMVGRSDFVVMRGKENLIYSRGPK